jgi:hypothetical protein
LLQPCWSWLLDWESPLHRLPPQSCGHRRPFIDLCWLCGRLFLFLLHLLLLLTSLPRL